MRRMLQIGLLVALATLAACRAPDAAPSAVPTSDDTAATITAQPAATDQPVATPTPLPATQPPTAAASGPDESAAAATPETLAGPVFPIPPRDRDLFADGLVPEAQEALELLARAPVYHMTLNIADSLTQLDGRQTVYYVNNEDVPLDEVYFHLHPNLLDGAITVSDVTVDGMPVEAERVEGDTALRVPLGKSLQPGKQAIIDMSFTTEVPTSIGRNYGILSYFEDTLALAHFYPMLSVYDDAGWNITPADIQGDITYSDTGFYVVEVTAPADLTLVGAGREIAREDDGETQTVRYAAGPARDFFLAASDDYTKVSREVGDITVNSYAPRNLQDGAAMAAEVAAAALETHGAWLTPYPYTELDIVTTPTSALGIEYPGIIVGTLRMYDIDAQTGSGVPFSVILESTTAHEVGHQWFYNLVGNDQLDEPWLDEALVQYITYRYFLDRYGSAGGESYFSSLEGRWARVDEAEIPIGRPVAGYDEAEYGAIVYGRGPIFVRALAEAMGQETFDAFLRDYVTQFSWGIGTTAEFRALAEQHCACDLGELFAAWVEP